MDKYHCANLLDRRVDMPSGRGPTKRGTEGTEVLKRELNSFFRRRRSSETSGKSSAEKGHGDLPSPSSRFPSSSDFFRREFSMEYSSGPFSPSSTASRSRIIR